MSSFRAYEQPSRTLSAYLLGTVPVETTIAFQRRLMYDAGEGGAGPTVILCQHTKTITVGRDGSRRHIRLTPEELLARGWQVRWVARGGGCLLHTPGQLAVYPIVSLAEYRLTPFDYLTRLCEIVVDVLRRLNVPGHIQTDPEALAVRVDGRAVALVGVSVRSGVSGFGFVLNVDPDLELYASVDCDPTGLPLSSLARLAVGHVRPAAVRQAVLDAFVDRFGLDTASVFHSHPGLVPTTSHHANPTRRCTR